MENIFIPDDGNPTFRPVTFRPATFRPVFFNGLKRPTFRPVIGAAQRFFRGVKNLFLEKTLTLVSLKKVMPNVVVKGCGFHITQGMFKNLKKIG